MSNIIEKAEQFLIKEFDESEYFKAHESEKRYRLEHSYRVANILKQIAIAEGFDVDAAVTGGLLHDISYAAGIETNDEWVAHGRKAAKIVSGFLSVLNLGSAAKADIVYGIAIHVDNKADFDGERTPFACSIGEADNIDRFDAYRIFDNLRYFKFDEMSIEDKKLKLCSILNELQKYSEMTLSTETATALWKERIRFQTEYYVKLQAQLENSTCIL